MTGDRRALRLPAKAPPTTAERALPRGWRRLASRAESPGRPERLRQLAQVALLPVAMLLWLVSLRHVDLGHMRRFGLVSVLPVTYWIALALLTISFTLALRRPRINVAWLAGHVIGLIAMLHATPTLLYGTLRYSWTWKHVAVIDYLLRHGTTDTTNGDLGVYHQWPGFFTLNAMLVRAAGLSSSTAYAAWAPVINNLLLIGPLVLLFRSMTSDRRLVWAAVWVFFSCSWVGQDYLSPQAFAFFLYVTVIALLLNRLKRTRPSREVNAAAADPAFPVVTARRPRGGLTWFLLLLPLVAAISSSHQLTPVILISALGILTIAYRRWRITLPLFLTAAAFTVVWCATVARPFIQANLHSILKSFGSLDSNVGSQLASQATTSAEQRLIAHVESGMTVVIGVVALIAVARWPDLRRSPALLLSLSPLPLLAANDYGGEIIFRVYLFALPATAFLGAALIQRLSRRPNLRSAAFLVVFPALLGGFVLGYYGKERMNYFSPAEVAASQYMYSTAPHGSMIVAATAEYPAAYTEYEYYTRVSWLANLSSPRKAEIERDPAGALAAFMRDSHGRPAYFILTRSQEAEVELSGLLPPATLARVEQIPGNAPSFTVIYRNTDAVVLVLATQPPSGVSGSGVMYR